MSGSHLGLRRRLPPLGALRAFEAAARHGSFKLAAAELAVTPTAISHQIRGLEENIGLSLFERRVRQVMLTEAGLQLYPVLREGFDAFEAAIARLTRGRSRIQITITATSAFTAKWLVPRVSGFRALHPDIDLHLLASDDAIDLDAAGADLAIRYGRGPYPGLSAEAMFADRFAPVVNPLLRKIAFDDLTGDDPEAAPLIHFRWQTEASAEPDLGNLVRSRGIALSIPARPDPLLRRRARDPGRGRGPGGRPVEPRPRGSGTGGGPTRPAVRAGSGRSYLPSRHQRGRPLETQRTSHDRMAARGGRHVPGADGRPSFDLTYLSSRYRALNEQGSISAGPDHDRGDVAGILRNLGALRPRHV